MAKKKANTVAKAAAAAAAAAVKASTQEDDDRLLLNFGDDDEDEDEANDILEGLEQLDEGGDVTYWELYCDTPLEKAGQIRKLATSELRGLRDECLSLGPGEYHVIARGRTGKFVPKSRRRIKISGFARPAVAPAAPANTPDPLALMQQMEERLERRRLEAKREREANIKFWAPILAPIGIELAKGLFSRGGSGESIKDLVGALVGMKDLVGAGGKENGVDTLIKGMELARDLEPSSSKGSTWPDALINGVATVAKEFRPLAESIAQRRAVAAPAGPAQLQFQPTTPGGATQPAPASGAPLPAPATTEDNNMLAMVTPLLQRLAGELEEYAANATDAGLTAEALLAKIPRTLRSMVTPEQMQSWLQTPDWWARTVQFHPALQPYQAFCDDVRLALLELFQPDEGAPEPGESE